MADAGDPASIGASLVGIEAGDIVSATGITAGTDILPNSLEGRSLSTVKVLVGGVIEYGDGNTGGVNTGAKGDVIAMGDDGWVVLADNGGCHGGHLALFGFERGFGDVLEDSAELHAGEIFDIEGAIGLEGLVDGGKDQ